MALTLTLHNSPSVFPDWYPPVDPSQPHKYWLKDLYFRLVVRVLVSLEVLDGPAGFTGETECCRSIARGLRRLASGPLPQELFDWVKTEWNRERQAFIDDVHARGEVFIQEPDAFEWTPASLRNDLLHFGVFNAIAADCGGYSIE